jgi:two-component system sensor histidine kinase QseC
MVGSTGLFRSGFRTVMLGDKAWRVFATFGAERDVQVYVGEQVDSRTGILLAVLRNTLMPLLWALPLLAGVAWWAVRQGTAPLRRLGATLGTRQAQALHPVVVPDAPSEMAPMVAALNGLFERITALMDSERRFTADAAHELRTPIAAIRTQAQVALGAEDDASRRHALEATVEGCDRARRLVEQLLTLSRLEAGHAPEPGLVDLAALTRQEVGLIAPQALARGQTIDLDAPAPCAVRGDATLVAVLVRNLVDNAVRYSLPSSQIHVAVHAVQGQVQLSVDDSGPGLDEASRLRLGERFFRVLGSGQSGSGLGWSIVRRIAAAHGAQVQTTTSASLGGLAVTVRWPTA